MNDVLTTVKSGVLRGGVALVLGALLATAVACEDDGPLGIDDDVASVQFDAQSETVEIGSTTQLAFEIRDADGDLVDPGDVTIDFSSSATGVATVSDTGLVTPVAAGTAVITIEAGGVTDTITIHVIAEISSIEVALDETLLVTDETRTLQLDVRNAAGEPVVDPALEFSSSNTAVLTVDEDGVITAVGAGEATITVEGGGESDTIVVTVLAAQSGGVSAPDNSFNVLLGQAIAIADLVTVVDAGGVLIPGAELEFESSATTIVTVDAAGLLTPLLPGSALVTVTSPDADGSATFRVTVHEVGVIGSIELDPAVATIAVGGEVTLTAIATTTGGATVENFLVEYASDAEAVATVDPVTGEVTGIAAGVATITATSGMLTAESTITVE